MQVKYLSALKTKYASFGLSKEALDRVASQRVKTIANEEEIDTDIASFETTLLVMKEMQGATDALRASNAKVQKELESLKSQQTQTPETKEEEKNPEIAEMKTLLLELVRKNAESEKKARHESIVNAVHAKMKELGCDNDALRNMTLKGIEIGDNDTADSLAEKYKTEYDSNCKLVYGDGYVPPKGGAGGAGEIDFSSMVAGLKASGDL